MSISLPDFIEYQAGRPRLNKPISMSRYGERAISMIQNGDEWWTVNIETQPMYDEDLAEFEGWLAQAQNGMETIVYTVLGKQSLPRAYWSNPNSSVPADNGSLTSVTNGKTLLIGSVTVGLAMTKGDLISLTSADYHSLHRVTANATAGATITLPVEPPVPSYIADGATVRFKDPVLNTRIVPGSTEVGDGVMPTAKFQLIEVPR